MAIKVAKILGMGAVLLVVFLVGGASAAVTGTCVSCHTMHDSQNGADMRLDGPPVAGTFTNECIDCHVQLRANLLRMDCVGCHAEDTAGGTISALNAPQVYYGEGGNELAAGNFSYVSGFLRDNYGHNVHGLNLPNDGQHLNTPPGYFGVFDPLGGAGYQAVYPGAGFQQVMCAGAQGCHGDRTELSQSAAVRGAHHADDSILQFGTIDQAAQGGTVGTSYRFLLNVKGGEDDDWHDTNSKSDHNEYFGQTFSSDAAVVQKAYGDGSIETMSNLCGECHGDFHAAGQDSGGSDGIGATGLSPWIRHPNDIALPAVSPWNAYTDYSVEVPVGRTTIPVAAPDSLVASSTNGKIVMCLSCHKAHASQYPDMLRFDYDLMLTGTTGAGQGKGCFTCHSLKDG